VTRLVITVALAMLACERDRTQTVRKDPPPVEPAKPPTDDGKRLADELARLPAGHVIYLAGVGWLGLDVYAAYEGRNPRTGEPVRGVPKQALVRFTASEELYAAIDHEPQVAHVYASERDRYLAALNPREPNAADYAQLEVVQLPWTDALAQRVHRELAATGSSEIPQIGSFSVRPHDGGAVVRLTVASEMKDRLHGR
jgi:nucleoid DNA-binding protein